jgi:hypothetical protein
MSRRGTGFRGKHSGRGRGSKNSSSDPHKSPKKSLQDYVYYIGSAKQVSDFLTTTEYIINYIRRTFTQGNDIANALETREEVNMTDFMPFSSNQLNKILQKQQSKINSMRYCIEQRFRSMWKDQPFMRPTKIRLHFVVCSVQQGTAEQDYVTCGL